MLSDDDRELLRLAAIACGELRGEWVGNDAYFDGVLSRWSPLTDDGDALRLAVTLRISVAIGPDSSGARVEHAVGWHSSMVTRSSDPCADTRRAIVRVAAALGRQR